MARELTLLVHSATAAQVCTRCPRRVRPTKPRFGEARRRRQGVGCLWWNALVRLSMVACKLDPWSLPKSPPILSLLARLISCVLARCHALSSAGSLVPRCARAVRTSTPLPSPAFIPYLPPSLCRVLCARQEEIQAKCTPVYHAEGQVARLRREAVCKSLGQCVTSPCVCVECLFLRTPGSSRPPQPLSPLPSQTPSPRTQGKVLRHLLRCAGIPAHVGSASHTAI